MSDIEKRTQQIKDKFEYKPEKLRTWDDVLSREGKMNPAAWIALLFVPWKNVIAPDCMPHELIGNGGPLYRYKEFRGSTYLIQPVPSPGFPGS